MAGQDPKVPCRTDGKAIFSSLLPHLRSKVRAPASVRLPTESTDGNLPAETFGAYGEKAGEGQVSGPYGEKGGEGWRGERRGENLFSRRR